MKKLFYILLISLLISTPSINAENAINSVTFTYPNNVTLKLTEKKFTRENHAITLCKEAVCLIDKMPLWGSDGKTPETKLTSAILNTGKHVSELDTNGMYNPLIHKNKKQQYRVSHYYGDTWKVKGMFSDGSGTYFAEWLITKDGSIRTLLGDSELLYDSFDSLFKKNK